MKINTIDAMLTILFLLYVITYSKTPTDPGGDAALARVIALQIQGIGLSILFALSLIYDKVIK